MPDSPSNAQLLRSLGRLVRGLSALFWGLPAALILCFYTANAEALRAFRMIPPIATTSLLVYGLWQCKDFQKQERVWQSALDRARLLSIINLGLSPFLYWWSRVPNHPFFLAMVICFAVSSLLFLASINLLLQRLAAMLPDETLRLETRQFTTMNLNLLCATLLAGVAYWALGHVRNMPSWLGLMFGILEHGSYSYWFAIVLVLLPLAMTMALLWKTKEVILESIFSGKQ